jgi:hypothetical protein
MGTNVGYADAPAGFAGTNPYLGLVTEVASCPTDGPRKARSVVRLNLRQPSQK